MISRKLAGVSAATVGAATAAAALLLGTVSGNAAQGQVSSAFGIASEGLIDIDPTPFVQSTDGTRQEDSLLGGGFDEEGLVVDALVVSAEPGRASSQALEVDLGDDGLGLGDTVGDDVGDDGGLSIEVLTTTCENGQGDVEILGGSLGGDELPSDPSEGENLDASPLLEIEFNRQTRNEDGTLTVEGLVVTLLPIDENDQIRSQDYGLLRDLLPTGTDLPAQDSEQAPDNGGELLDLLEGEGLDLGEDEPLLRLVLTSATCGEKGKDKVVPTPAPVPTPTKTNLPVTH